jgi:DNA-binding beta-propeller fold protein YncE
LPLVGTGCGGSGARVVEPVLIFGEPGRREGQFHFPRAVDFLLDGTVLVMDRSERIQRFTPEGEYLGVWRTPSIKRGNPRGLDVAPNGELYVADTHNSEILVYSPEGRIIRRWGSYGTGPGQFIWVTDVAVDARGFVYACEYGEGRADRLQKFDTQGRFMLQWASFGSQPGEVQRPQGLALDRQGHLFVADGVNHRVQVFAPDGRMVAVIGGLGSEPGKLRYPYDVAIDAAGRLYVCEFGNHRVSVFELRASDPGPAEFRTPKIEYRLITTLGRAGRGPGEFNHPWGVGVDAAGFIYVADTYNYRVQKFAPLPP